MANPFGRQKRDRQRREVKAQREAIEADSAWARDPGETTEEFTETDGVSATTRISQRTVKYARNGQIVEFAVVVSMLEGDEWLEKLCIDSCNHGSVHRHRNGDHGSFEVIEIVTSQEVLQNQFWEAISEAYDEIRRLEAGNV